MHGITDAVRTLLLSVAAAVTGGLVIRWWDRARALVLIRGFVNIVAAGEIECSDELCALTRRVWRHEPLAKKERADRVRYANRRVREERCHSLEDAALLPRLRSQLAAAASDDHVLEVVKAMMDRYALPYAIVEAVERSMVVPPRVTDASSKLRVEFEEEFDNGRFMVLSYAEDGKSIGANLNGRPALTQQLDEWLKAMRSLRCSPSRSSGPTRRWSCEAGARPERAASQNRSKIPRSAGCTSWSACTFSLPARLDGYWPFSCGWECVNEDVDGERAYPLHAAT